MNRTKTTLCILAVVAILAVSTAMAVTQLYVDPYFKYRGHWVFPKGSGSEVTIRVQNVTGSSKGVRVDFSGGLVNPPDPVDGPFSIGATIFDSLNAGQTTEMKFTLPQPITSLNFLRIRRNP